MRSSLPALVLANVTNASDTTVRLASGETVSASVFLKSLGESADLRFMASSTQGFSAAHPRVTWALSGGDVVVSLAFPSEADEHGRMASSAIVFAAPQVGALPPSIPEQARLPVEDFLRRHGRAIAAQITQARATGSRGGEVDLKKKAGSPSSR